MMSEKEKQSNAFRFIFGVMCNNLNWVLEAISKELEDEGETV